MNKIIKLGLIGLTVIVTMTGCCISHDWKEATCTEAKTCSKCGKIEGEPLGHEWIEATCTTPKTCSRCGETEGEAEEHQLSEATYQQPATCSVCGEQIGDKLQADFEKYGLECVELNRIYNYTTQCYNDASQNTTAKLVYTNYQVFDSDENHEAKEGYEWHTVDVILLFNDEASYRCGWSLDWCREGYYDIIYNDENAIWYDDASVDFKVMYNGTEYDCHAYTSAVEKMICDIGDKSVRLRGRRENYLVPIGYDGCVYGMRNDGIEWKVGQHVNDIDNTDTLFFRFANADDIKEFIPDDYANVNLSDTDASDILTLIYYNLENYFDKNTIDYFDYNQNGQIDQNESTDFMAWAISKYTSNVQQMSLEEAYKIAYDFMTERLSVPDTLFKPE